MVRMLAISLVAYGLLSPPAAQARACDSFLEQTRRRAMLWSLAAAETLIPQRNLRTAAGLSFIASGLLTQDIFLSGVIATAVGFYYPRVVAIGPWLVRPIPITGRAVSNYLTTFGLWTYPFEGKTILDLGCGRTQFGAAINSIYGKTGTRSIGLDIAHGVQEGPLNVTAQMEQLPFADEAFDLVLASWSLPYSESPSLVMSEALRVLRKGGVIQARIPKGMLNHPIGLMMSADLAADPRVSSMETKSVLHSDKTVVLVVTKAAD